AIWLRRLRGIYLGMVIVIAGVALFLASMPFGDASGGWASENFGVGLLRVAFGFLVGVGLSRIHRAPAARWGIWALWLAILLVAIPIALPGDYGGRAIVFDIAMTGVIFPLAVWLASNCALGPIARWSASFFGDVSYPLYATHYPLLLLARSWITGTGPVEQ